MADSFGLTPEEFADNFAEYVRHGNHQFIFINSKIFFIAEVRQVQKDPNDVAKEYMTDEYGAFPTPEKVICFVYY